MRNRSHGITAAIAPKASCVVLAGGDQRGADARIKTDFLVDGPGIGLEGAGMPTLGLAEHRADQAVKQVDRLVSQAGGEVQADGDQRRVPALPLVTGDMLDGGAASLASKLGKARLVDQMSTAGLDADRANMLQALDQAEHGAPAWRPPASAATRSASSGWFLPDAASAHRAASLLGGEPIGQPAIHFPPGLVAELRRRAARAPAATGRRSGVAGMSSISQFGQMGEPIILDGLRQKRRLPTRLRRVCRTDEARAAPGIRRHDAGGSAPPRDTRRPRPEESRSARRRMRAAIGGGRSPARSARPG